MGLRGWQEEDSEERPGQAPHYVVEKSFVATPQGYFHAGGPTHFFTNGVDVWASFKVRVPEGASGTHAPESWGPGDLDIYQWKVSALGREHIIHYQLPLPGLRHQLAVMGYIGEAPRLAVDEDVALVIPGGEVPGLSAWLDEIFEPTGGGLDELEVDGSLRLLAGIELDGGWVTVPLYLTTLAGGTGGVMWATSTDPVLVRAALGTQPNANYGIEQLRLEGTFRPNGDLFWWQLQRVSGLDESNERYGVTWRELWRAGPSISPMGRSPLGTRGWNVELDAQARHELMVWSDTQLEQGKLGPQATAVDRDVIDWHLGYPIKTLPSYNTAYYYAEGPRPLGRVNHFPTLRRLKNYMDRMVKQGKLQALGS